MKIARVQPAVLPWVAGLLLLSLLTWGGIELFRVEVGVEEPVDMEGSTTR